MYTRWMDKHRYGDEWMARRPHHEVGEVELGEQEAEGARLHRCLDRDGAAHGLGVDLRE